MCSRGTEIGLALTGGQTGGHRLLPSGPFKNKPDKTNTFEIGKCSPYEVPLKVKATVSQLDEFSREILRSDE